MLGFTGMTAMESSDLLCAGMLISDGMRISLEIIDILVKKGGEEGGGGWSGYEPGHCENKKKMIAQKC